MSKKKPLISVLVLNWNGKRFIDPFFDSIAKQTYGTENIEVIFIDNNSSDDSVEYFLSKKIPYARYVQTGANRGYAGGNNYGFKKAKGKYIAVCNNDLVLTPTWLENLVASAEETNADITVPKVVYLNTDTINNAGSILKKDSDWPNLERGINESAKKKEFATRAEVTAICGASPLFNRTFLEKVGLFDKHFFLYWEDTDLSWRGQNFGATYIYEPTAVTYHDASGSTGGETSPVFNHYVSRNRVLVLIKNGSHKLALKAFAKVGRDHVLYKIRDLFNAAKSGQGRKPALKRLWNGTKIIGDIIRLTPLMLLKRWKIVQEEKV